VIVVDTMVLTHLVVDGARTAEVLAVRQLAPEWAAPALWRSELRNVLAKLLRSGDLTLPTATRTMMAAEKVMRGRVWRVGTRQILALVLESGCSAYDCEFVALAKAHGVPLVTLDKQVLRAFPGIAESPGDFVRARGSHPVHVIAVTCDDKNLRVRLDDGREVSAPLSQFPRLLSATPAARAHWELIGAGEGIHWPDVDEDISVDSLLGLPTD
jgi:predicted nucleic acid-binding protein